MSNRFGLRRLPSGRLRKILRVCFSLVKVHDSKFNTVNAGAKSQVQQCQCKRQVHECECGRQGGVTRHSPCHSAITCIRICLCALRASQVVINSQICRLLEGVFVVLDGAEARVDSVIERREYLAS